METPVPAGAERLASILAEHPPFPVYRRLRRGDLCPCGSGATWERCHKGRKPPAWPPPDPETRVRWGVVLKNTYPCFCLSCRRSIAPNDYVLAAYYGRGIRPTALCLSCGSGRHGPLSHLSEEEIKALAPRGAAMAPPKSGLAERYPWFIQKHCSPIPHHARDTELWYAAVALKRQGVHLGDALDLQHLAWEACEQPDRDFYPEALALEKVERVYQGERPAFVKEVDELTAPKPIIVEWGHPAYRLPSASEGFTGIEGYGMAQSLYREAGLHTIPVVPGEKRPLVPWYSLRDTPPTEAQYAEWRSRYRNANLGILLEISGLVVADFDIPGEFERHPLRDYWLAHTPVVRTPRGGVHVYFQATEPIGIAKFKGGDIKSTGIVLAPPSATEKGGYRLLNPEVGTIIHLVAGAHRYIKEQVITPLEFSAVAALRGPRVRHLSPALMENIEADETLRKDKFWKLEQCGVWGKWWRCSNGHRVCFREHCSVKGCPHAAWAKVKAWVEEQKPRISRWKDPRFLYMPVNPSDGDGTPYGEAWSAVSRLAQAAGRELRKGGRRGDIFLPPCPLPGGEDFGGCVVIAGDGIRREDLGKVARDTSVVEGEIDDVEAFYFAAGYAVRSGNNLYAYPKLFVAWMKARGNRGVRGVEIDEAEVDGAVMREQRRGFGGGGEKRACPYPGCGASMRPEHVLSPVRWEEALKDPELRPMGDGLYWEEAEKPEGKRGDFDAGSAFARGKQDGAKGAAPKHGAAWQAEQTAEAERQRAWREKGEEEMWASAQAYREQHPDEKGLTW